VPATIEPWAEELLNAYLVARSTGKAPWELGRMMSRRRFYEAAAIFSGAFELSALMKQCPLAGL